MSGRRGLFAFVVGAGLVGCGPKPAPAPAPPAVEAPAPPSEFPRLDGTEPVFGPPDAPLVLLQYSDFLCPHCAVGFERVVAYVSSHPDTRLVWKTFPLSGECNPKLGVSTLPARCTLAYVAECGARAGRFRETATAIYAEIGPLSAAGATPDNLARVAARAGLEPVALQACIAEPSVHEAVVVDADEGMRLRIRGTPSFWATRAGSDDFVLVEGDVAPALEQLDAWRSK